MKPLSTAYAYVYSICARHGYKRIEEGWQGGKEGSLIGAGLGRENRIRQTTPPIGAEAVWTTPGVAVCEVFWAFAASDRNGCARGWVFPPRAGARIGAQEQEMGGKSGFCPAMRRSAARVRQSSSCHWNCAVGQRIPD